MTSDSSYRNNRSEFRYRMQLQKAFEGTADNIPRSADEAFRLRDRKMVGSLANRATPIETFVSRTAALVNPLDGHAQISSEQSIIAGTPPEQILTLRFNDQAFEVRDLWPDRYPSALSTHYDNKMFLESASVGVLAFTKAIATEFPALTEVFPDLLRRLDNRLRQDCHSILAFNARRERWTEFRRTRNRPDLDGWVPKGVK